MISSITHDEFPGYQTRIADIYLRAFESPRDQADQFGQMITDRGLARPGSLLLGYWHGDALVGFLFGYQFRAENWWYDQLRSQFSEIALAPFAGNAFELMELAVLPEYQGLGVGSAIIQHLHGTCIYPNVLLGTSNDPDNRARNFYLRHGYQTLTKNFTYPSNGESQWIMVRKLP